MEASRDLSALSVSLVGELVATDDPWEPFRLVDPLGAPVEGVSDFLRDLQGAGRPATTARSYVMDLLRWFRFLWAVEVPWDRATRSKARDFSRWLQVAGQPSRPHWRRPDEIGRWVAGGKPYAPSVRIHSETVIYRSCRA
ncbi:site-specific integrase [Streptomyces sp. NPDC047515]|uniref:site-specific integrase n=1 Tax=Streptomyces sp. NPDC047515 TaxID=3155380 RepID=UPI003402ABAB